MEPSSVRFYRLLLRLYPRNFQEQYGPEMLQFFRLSLQEAAAENRLVGFWLATLWDVFSSSLTQHFKGITWAKIGSITAALALLLMLEPLIVSEFCQGSPICTEPRTLAAALAQIPINLLILLGVFAVSRKGWLERSAVGLQIIYLGAVVIYWIFVPDFKVGVNINTLSIIDIAKGILFFLFAFLPSIALCLMSFAFTQLGNDKKVLSVALFILSLETVKLFLFSSTYLLSSPYVLSAMLMVFFAFKAAALLVIIATLWRSSPLSPTPTEATTRTL